MRENKKIPVQLNRDFRTFRIWTRSTAIKQVAAFILHFRCRPFFRDDGPEPDDGYDGRG